MGVWHKIRVHSLVKSRYRGREFTTQDVLVALKESGFKQIPTRSAVGQYIRECDGVVGLRTVNHSMVWYYDPEVP
jgi:hypothetical protein